MLAGMAPKLAKQFEAFWKQLFVLQMD